MFFIDSKCLVLLDCAAYVEVKRSASDRPWSSLGERRRTTMVPPYLPASLVDRKRKAVHEDVTDSESSDNQSGEQSPVLTGQQPSFIITAVMNLSSPGKNKF